MAGFLFAASLMLQPCFLREQNNDTLSALRLSVSDPFAHFSRQARRQHAVPAPYRTTDAPGVLDFVSMCPPARSSLPSSSFSFWQPRHFRGRHGALRDFRASPHARIDVADPAAAVAYSGPDLPAPKRPRLCSTRPRVSQGLGGFLAIFDVVFLTAMWLFGEYLLEE